MSPRISTSPPTGSGRPVAGHRATEPPGAPWSAGIDAASWAAIAAFAAAIAWVAFRLHVVGDYSTESDFYGGYAEGARLLQGGRVDFARYPVVGPGYEFALALVGLVVRDPFTAARLISVASAVGALILWRDLLRRLGGGTVALWTVALLAANGVFFRYAYSATTDMLALLLQAATLRAILVSGHRLAPLASGVIAALAVLTRYNYAYLVPVAVACYAGLAPAPRSGRRGAIALHLAGFALVAAPWWGASVAAGHWPGASLFAQFGSFYTVNDATRNVQDLTAAQADSLAAARDEAGAAARGLAATVVDAIGRVPDHLRRDGLELLGLPAALLCLAGLGLAIADGSWRALLPLWASGAVLFLTLAPVFYSDRYSMALAPVYLSMAGVGLASPRGLVRWRRATIPLAWGLGLAVLAFSARGSFELQERLLGNQPVEVIEAGRVLRRDSRAGDFVMSRKGQVGHYAGRATVPFPRVTTLAELGDHARRANARYLYYSWYEAFVRPEFSFLLDTTAAVPGLTAIHRSERNPGVLYRIGPGFGNRPEWFADPVLASLHRARAQIQYLPAAQAAESHSILAAHAFARDDPAGVIEHVEKALAGGLLRPPAWHWYGEALRSTGRLEEAVLAYERAIALDPNHVEARLGLGWAQLGLGRTELAARAWLPAIGPRTDTYTLREMTALYDRLGQSGPANSARAELARRQGEE